MYIGAGVKNTTKSSISLNATGGVGTNIVGGDLTIAGGKSTGNAIGGTIFFAISAPSASGSTQNILTNIASVTFDTFNVLVNKLSVNNEHIHTQRHKVF